MDSKTVEKEIDQEVHVEIERVLKSDKINLILSVMNYVLLIFVTLFIGFGIYGGIKYKGKTYLSPEATNTIATFSLVIIWTIFLAISILKLKAKLN